LAIHSDDASLLQRAAMKWDSPALAVAALTLAYVAAHAVAGFPSLADAHGDNDSLLRLVQIRDLLAGQSWFDLTQYRMGLESGFVMHWSRLVDLPVALLILAGEAVTGSRSAGEIFALVAWPALLFFAILHVLVRGALLLAGPSALLPALVIGTSALHFTTLIWPGTIDHHNIQLALAAMVMVAVMPARPTFRAGLLAGLGAALMIAIGMESVPMVAAGGAVAAFGFLAAPGTRAEAAKGFGIGFAGMAVTALVATIPPGAWLASTCDAYSGRLALLAVTAGAGLALAAGLSAQLGPAIRLAALGLLGLILAGMVLVIMPGCLADPYASLDPRLQRYWLSAVSEAQSIASVARNEPRLLAGYYVTPLMGLAWLAASMRRRGTEWPLVVTAAMLGAAVLVSLWQIRGAMFAVPLATVPLAAWVGGLRSRTTGKGLKPVLAWLVSINVLWSGAASALSGVAEVQGPAGSSASAGSECYAAGDYARLASIDPARILAVSNLGAPILRHSAHKVVAGPYHRNVAGNLAALDMLMASPEAGLRRAADEGVTLIVHCPGNREAATLAGWAPGSLAALLVAGETPPGHERISLPGEALAIFRRRSAAAR